MSLNVTLDELGQSENNVLPAFRQADEKSAAQTESRIIPHHQCVNFVCHFLRRQFYKCQMIKILIVVILIMPIIANGQLINRVDGSKISIDSLSNKISFLMQEAKVTGLAITIFNQNNPVFSKTFGTANSIQKTPITQKSQMVAASFSKLVFSYIVMQLVQEKILHLDTPLVEYLDKPLTEYKFLNKNQGYSDLQSDDRYKKITARMCLTHTTGFPNWRWYEDDNKLKFLFNPGSRYRYSGEGLFLLQFVIEKITGKNYETLSQERVFKPLNMKNTSQVWQNRFDTIACYGHNSAGKPYELIKRKEPNAAGSMVTTPEDITRFYTALLKGKGLTRKYFKEMTNTRVRIKSLKQFGAQSMTDGEQNENIQLGYGYGVGVLKSPYGRAFFKEGNDDGWQHYCIAFPEKRIAVLIMTNSDNGDSIFKYLLEYAIADKYTPWDWNNYIPYDKRN
jgi:serine-type D-Ala-D-Ala carboxypeptidase/endopeptidase